MINQSDGWHDAEQFKHGIYIALIKSEGSRGCIPRKIGCRGSLQQLLKPKFNRRNIMKSSTQDNAEGKMHQVIGKVKETVGKVVKDRSLESEGAVENLEGKVQEKIGEIKKVAGK